MLVIGHAVLVLENIVVKKPKFIEPPEVSCVKTLSITVLLVMAVELGPHAT